jgi:hypothetical protein
MGRGREDNVGKRSKSKRRRRRNHIGYWWESQTRPLGRAIRTWLDNIKIDLGETRWDGMAWT